MGLRHLDFEFARAACVEIYAVLIGCGLELSRDSHLRMAELCHCTKNLIESKAFDIARVDLVVYSNGAKHSRDESQAIAAGLIGIASSGFDQTVATLPGFAQAGPDTLFLVLGGLGIRAFDETGGLLFRQLQQDAVPDQVGDAEIRQAGLACAEKFSRTAQLKIQFGEFEAILRAHHGGEALLGLG